MNKVRIAVLVSGGGTNLQALLDAEKNGILRSGEICLVISNRKSAYALERAKAAGVEAVFLSKKKLGSQEAYEQEILRLFEAHGIELVILAGYLSILSADFTRRFPKRMINVHPSLIPSFCGDGYYGLHVHEAALGYGVKVTGATVHYVNEITDSGEIISQKAVNVEEGDTPETLQKRVMEQAEWLLLPEAAEKISAEILKEGKR